MSERIKKVAAEVLAEQIFAALPMAYSVPGGYAGGRADEEIAMVRVDDLRAALLASVLAARLDDGLAAKVRELAEKGFIGSIGAMTALFDVYVLHIGYAEQDGPLGPYMWCVCGWRSDDLGSDNPGRSYAVHLSNALHAAIVAPINEQFQKRLRALLNQPHTGTNR